MVYSTHLFKIKVCISFFYTIECLVNECCAASGILRIELYESRTGVYHEKCDRFAFCYFLLLTFVANFRNKMHNQISHFCT